MKPNSADTTKSKKAPPYTEGTSAAADDGKTEGGIAAADGGVDSEIVDAVAARVLSTYRKAFEELAK